MKKVAASRASWTVMLAEENARARITQEAPEIIKVLDFMSGRMKVFTDSKGWTTFNDWLDKAYGQLKYRTSDIPAVPIDRIRAIVFPASR